MSDTPKPHRVISVTVNEWEIDNLRDRIIIQKNGNLTKGARQ